jgi:aspartyl-tRNA(Asn)/glutamyl-tRNA(Gln) amidotransferase subunit B
MEEGSLRCEPNISVRPAGTSTLGTKTELKNLNSFRAVQMGSAFEIRRQSAELDNGGTVHQETRGWNEQREASYLMRVKESENDYRYFPDPDLAPMVFDEAYIERLRAELPELPLAKFRRYQADFGLSAYDANLLIADRAWSVFFEECVAFGGEPKAICNLMNSDFAKLLNEAGITARESKLTPAHLVELNTLVAKGTISGKIAKTVIADSFATGEMPAKLVEASGATQVSDTGAIQAIVDQVLANNPDVVAKYKAGAVSVKGFLVGQVMKESKGRANPQLANELVQSALDAI